MTDHERTQLTPVGEARREAMLGELVGAMQRVHHGRRVRRRVGSTFVVLGVSAVVVWTVVSQLTGLNSEPRELVREHQPEPVRDNTPADRPSWRDVHRTGLVRTVGDDELVALLAQLDRPAGIVRSEGEIWLTNAVTDAELGLTPPEPADPSTM